MLIWYSWSHDGLWKVMMKHKKSSVWLRGELKDALGYTSLRDCWDSGVPQSTKFKDTKYIMGHSDPLNIFLLEQSWVLIPHCATAHDSQRYSKRQTLGSTLNTPSGGKVRCSQTGIFYKTTSIPPERRPVEKVCRPRCLGSMDVKLISRYHLQTRLTPSWLIQICAMMTSSEAIRSAIRNMYVQIRFWHFTTFQDLFSRHITWWLYTVI